jgi:hypothetical protein
VIDPGQQRLATKRMSALDQVSGSRDFGIALRGQVAHGYDHPVSSGRLRSLGATRLAALGASRYIRSGSSENNDIIRAGAHSVGAASILITGSQLR